jgi:hypothetical protein
VLIQLVVVHFSYVNGPHYWQWPWRRIDPIHIYPVLAAAAIPFFAAQWVQRRGRWPVAVPLGLIMLSMFALQIGALAVQTSPISLERLAARVLDEDITGYYHDARSITELGPWLADYPQGMPERHLHSINKPPGPILFYLPFISWAGSDDSAAHAGGLVIGLLATIALPMTYLLIPAVSGDRRAAFRGAGYLALCPSLVLFLPEFDQVYAAIATALVLFWMLALKRNDWRCALGFGAVLSLLTFFSFHLLAIGVFPALYSIWFLVQRPGVNVLTILRHALVGLAVPAVFYAILWLTTGYDPLGTFRTALDTTAALNAILKRPYPWTILFDLTDFALGTAWISFLLVAFLVLRWCSARDGDQESAGASSLQWVSLFAIATPVTVAVTGLIRAETARTWIFMMPLVMIPVGIELSRWSFRSCLVVYFCLWLLTVAICQNMAFFR